MKVSISIKQINSEYNQEYADQYNFGRESENNQKYHFGTAWEIDDVLSININKNSNYPIKILVENDKTVHSSIPNMTLIECLQKNDKKFCFGVSNSLLDNKRTFAPHSFDEKANRYYLYIKDEMEFECINNTVFAATNDLP